MVTVAERRREVVLQMLAKHAVHGFRVKRERRRAQLGSKVLLVLEEEAAVGGIVEIPGAGGQFIEDVGLEGGEVATRALKAIDKLILPEAVDRSGRR